MTQFSRGTWGPRSHAHAAGFTLLEALIVAVIVGIIAAIAVPGFLGFLNQRKINASRDMVYQAIRATQAEAMQKRQEQQFSIRQRHDLVEWANHPRSIDPAQVSLWNPLMEGVILADIDNTLRESKGIHYVQFDMYGNLRGKWFGRQGTITLTVPSANQLTHRCVVVSTVLGALRKGQGHKRANSNGRRCY
ncbi:MAG: type II secretion system protein [Leptolyngbya sp. LCM1.Bin17]|nr:MAG: type II secretion system protein [Leptolyngbya sp. LCM1.Bin17]